MIVIFIIAVCAKSIFLVIARVSRNLRNGPGDLEVVILNHRSARLFSRRRT
jgi:hypothetical protein